MEQNYETGAMFWQRYVKKKSNNYSYYRYRPRFHYTASAISSCYFKRILIHIENRWSEQQIGIAK